MRKILFLVFIPFFGLSQQIPTKKIVSLFEKHSDTISIRKAVAEHGFSRYEILNPDDQWKLSFLTEKNPSEELCVYLKQDNGLVYYYKTGENNIFKMWETDLLALGYKKLGKNTEEGALNAFYSKNSFIVMIQEIEMKEGVRYFLYIKKV